MATKPIFEDKFANDSALVTGIPRESDSNHDIKVEDSDSYNSLGFWTRMGCTPESFKRRTLADKHNQLNQTLKSRHLHMIAIGGSIGAGLFVGSGGALRTGGPASLILDFSIIGVMIFNVVYALGELAIMYPISGGFYVYSSRFIDPAWGFAMGWNYCFQWAIVLPFEIVVASFCINYWNSPVPVYVWMIVFILAIVLVNIFGVLGYGEEEFWSSVLKLAAIVIFLVIGLVLVLGGGPSGGSYTEYLGARYWYDPGAFRNGFKGFCAVFVTAAFSFSGTEIVGLAAAESATPLLSLPSAVKQVFWRITLFYILSLLFIGLLVRSDNPDLIGTGDYINVTASPFVIVARDAGLFGFDSFMNAVILISVISIGNSGVYGGSRTLTALAEQGYAPRIFTYIDRAGRPLYSTIAIIAFAGLSFIAVAPNGSVVYEWLLATSGLAALFTWGSICLAHIRFRAAWRHHGRTLDEIPFQAAFGVWGSWLGLIIVILVLIAQLFVAIAPPGNNDELNDAEGFFKSYLAFPIVLFFFGAGWVWKRTPFLTLDRIDVDSGRREIDWELHRAMQEKRKNVGPLKRIYYFLF